MRLAPGFRVLPAIAFATVASLAFPAEAPAANFRKVEGTLTYRDAGSNDNRQICYVKATVIPVLMPWFAKTVTTDSQGKFSVNLPAASIPPGSPVKVTFQSRNYAVDVYLDLDWANEWLTWSRTKTVPAGTGPVNLSTHVTVSNLSAHFNIADCIRCGRSYANSRRDDDDDISKAEVEYPDSSWSHFSPVWDEISLSGPAMWGHGGAVDSNGNPADHGFRDDVIVHEYGHHLTHDISDSDGSGGAHKESDDFGFDFAWSEGFPTYFAKAVQSWYPNRVTVSKNLEMSPGFAPGSEAMTWACLWDVHDPANEAHDKIAGWYGIDKVIFQIFDREIDEAELSTGKEIERNILGFHDAWRKRKPYENAHADLDRILFFHGIAPHGAQDYSVTVAAFTSGSLEPGESANALIQIARTRLHYSGQPVKVKVQMTRKMIISGKLQDYTYTLGTYDFEFPNLGLDVMNPANKKAAKWVTVKMPMASPSGAYKLKVTVDPEDQFPEANESNNSLTSTTSFTLEQLFDPGIHVPDGVQPGADSSMIK